MMPIRSAFDDAVPAADVEVLDAALLVLLLLLPPQATITSPQPAMAAIAVSRLSGDCLTFLSTLVTSSATLRFQTAVMPPRSLRPPTSSKPAARWPPELQPALPLPPPRRSPPWERRPRTDARSRRG